MERAGLHQACFVLPVLSPWSLGEGVLGFPRALITWSCHSSVNVSVSVPFWQVLQLFMEPKSREFMLVGTDCVSCAGCWCPHQTLSFH